jgi:uncharacterized protein (TIGR02611 family)
VRRERIKQRIGSVRDRHEHSSAVVKLGLTIAGAVLFVAGLAMLVLPGPAFLVIPLGLGLLSVRFEWARRLAFAGVDAVAGAAACFGRRSLWVKVALVVAAGALVAGVGVLVITR